MAKKLVERKHINNNTILETYKPSKDTNGPIIGTFKVKDVIAENTVSKNQTFYPTETLESKGAFGLGGRYINEEGKLRAAKLLGSLDHPEDDKSPEMRFESSAIAWRELTKEGKSWNGTVDILNTPAGRIAKTHLDYAKEVGGGDFFGVSIRALGESAAHTEGNQTYTKILPENFEILSIDFVYEPSFGNMAMLTESRKNKVKPLYESIRKLAKEDEKHAEIYESYATYIENQHLDPTIADFRNVDNDTALIKLNELSKAWALTFEGLAEDSIKDVIVYLKEKEAGANPKAHIFSGKQFNDIYELSGSNKYPEDLTIVAYTGYGMMLAVNMGARWLPDIIDNNARRERNQESHTFENKIVDFTNIKSVVENKLLGAAQKAYIQTLKDELNEIRNSIYELDKMGEEEFKAKHKNKDYAKALKVLAKEELALRTELDRLITPEQEVQEVAEKHKLTKEETKLDKTLELLTEEEIEAEEVEAEEEEAEEAEEVEAEEVEAEEELEAEEEAEEEVTLATVVGLLKELKAELDELKANLIPVEDDLLGGDLEDLGLLEDGAEEEEAEEEEAEEPEAEEPEAEEGGDLTEDDLENMTDDELLDYLATAGL